MQITAMGLVLIPIGIGVFFYKLKYLFYLLIFFSGFTGASILNFNDFSLQPAYYFGILIIIRYLFILNNKKSIVKPNLMLSIFIVISFISLIMPYLLQDKGVIVLNPDNNYAEIKFRSQNITQYMYILFCFIIYWLAKDYTINNNNNNIESFTKVFLYSAVLITTLGIYQEIAYIFNLPFDEIFRQGVHTMIQPNGYLVRLSSVAQEPSMHAIFLLVALVINNSIAKSIFKYKGTLNILILINGILSTSSTFFIGIVIIISIYILSLVKPTYRLNNVINSYKLILLSIVVYFILVNINPHFFINIIESLLDKINMSSKSGIERGNALLHHLRIGFQYPILGVGFGSVRSYDLFTTWLSSIGVLGMASFVFYLLHLIDFKYLFNNNTYKGYILATLIAFVSLFISVPEPYYIFLWINIAICEVIIVSKC